MKDNKVEPETIIHRQVADAREGREPRVVTRVYSGWVLFGQQQRTDRRLGRIRQDQPH